MKDNAVNEALKPSAALLLAHLLYNNYRLYEKTVLAEQICKKLARAKSFNQRKAFLTFLELALQEEVFSKSFFKMHFFSDMLNFQHE